MKRRTVLKAMLGTAMLGAGASWMAQRKLKSFVAADLAFGTTVSITVLHEHVETAHKALQAALSSLHGVDHLMSLHREDSQVSQLNRYGELAHPDARLLQVLQAAQAMSKLSGGAFDVTVQPLWQAANGEGRVQEALHHVDWRKLEVSAERIRLLDPDMSITLNGIAQGYAADLALARLRQHGINHALLDTGEFASLGARDDGQPWTLAVRDPRHEDQYSYVLAADGRCMATSGDYATRFSDDFLHHHIFDPATGDSPTELASVTVLAPTGMQADALSTAAMVLGAKKSIALAQQMPQIDLLCIAKSGASYRTAGFPSGLV